MKTDYKKQIFVGGIAAIILTKVFQARTVEHFGHIDPRKLFEPHSCKPSLLFFIIILMVGSSSSPVDLQYVGHFVTVTP